MRFWLLVLIEVEDGVAKAKAVKLYRSRQGVTGRCKRELEARGIQYPAEITGPGRLEYCWATGSLWVEAREIQPDVDTEFDFIAYRCRRATSITEPKPARQRKKPELSSRRASDQGQAGSRKA